MIQAARFCLFLFVAAMVAMGFLCAAADAGQPLCIRQNVVAHHKAFNYAHHQQAQVLYLVAPDLRIEAQVQKALRADPDYELFQKFKSWKNVSNGKPAMEPATDPAEVAQVNTPDNVVPILYKHCGGCHSGAAPKAGLLLDGSAYIDCKTLVKCIDEITAGTMPKAKPNQDKPQLSDGDEDAVIAALSRLVKQP